MRSVRDIAAALLLAVGSIGCSGGYAGADTGHASHRPEFLFFAGADLWRHGSFSHGGLLWSPQGLDKPGFTFKLLVGGGNYDYLSGALGDVTVSARQTTAFVLPGWRFIRGDVFVTLYTGLDVQKHQLQPDDPSSGLRGTEAGLRAAAEFWSTPTPTTMLAADASISTVGPSYSLRAAFGWLAFDRFYIGPEIQAFAGDDAYNQYRFGIHVTGLKMQDAEWSAAIGFARDSDKRSSTYGRMGVLVRR